MEIQKNSPAIAKLVLRCVNPDAQRRFYCDVLGMSEYNDGTVGYGGEEAALLFEESESSYTPAPNDLYWKIALSVPNIEQACQQLAEKGIQVSKPRQFNDVAYLAHFTDPEGFTIELIDHWFQGNRPNQTTGETLLGGGAHFSLLTLRSSEIDTITRSCIQAGMKLLSVQPVESHGFTLYFFAFTSDSMPSPDVYAVENREWLYQRRYTVLEIQHLHQKSDMRVIHETEAGYVGTVLSGCTDPVHIDELLIS